MEISHPNSALITYFRSLSNGNIAKANKRFFKTGKGQYGEGDAFLGVPVPIIRKVAVQNIDLPLTKVVPLLTSGFHEERMLALIIMLNQFKVADDNYREAIFETYLENIKFVNSWDLVDTSAPGLVGNYLEHKDRDLLHQWSRSENMWKRRIAIVSTLHFIRKKDYDDALNIANTLRHDREDLIQKAVGWMLREIGKRNMRKEETFLKQNYKSMPRTMLRYAIEKFPEKERQLYLKGDL